MQTGGYTAATGGVVGAGGFVSGSGGAVTGGAGTGGEAATGGAGTGGEAATGGAGTGGSSSCNPPNPSSELGTGVQTGSGSSDKQYETALVSRDGTPYVLITNGWGPRFQSQETSWNGTSFVVDSMMGAAGDGGEPATYPTVFCGRYSVQQAPDCGLPASIDSIASLKTGWRWNPNGDTDGEYNAAWDIWVGSATQRQGFLMVWLRDPPSYQPAGSPDPAHQGITVANVPGTWNIWRGTVFGSVPIINWVRAEGCDDYELEFDVMDFVRDAQMRNLTVPGTHIRAVAVGFEIWEGPVANLASEDFYVEVTPK